MPGLKVLLGYCSFDKALAGEIKLLRKCYEFGLKRTTKSLSGMKLVRLQR